MQIKTSVKYYFTSTHLEKLNVTVLSVSEDVNPQEFLYIAGRSEIGTSNWEDCFSLLLQQSNIGIPFFLFLSL